MQDENPTLLREWNRQELLLLGSFTLVAFLVHLAFYKGYGIFRDELYFIACSKHMDWGYVDHPPGVPAVAWLARHLMGSSLFAIRLVPVLFAALQLLLTGLTARAMGGRLYAMFLACLCVFAAPGYFSNYLNTDMFMTLGWSACACLAALILSSQDELGRNRNRHLWLWFGVVAGVGLQGKHAMLFFLAAFVAGLLLSPQRKILLTPWPYAGAGLALLIASPNLIWEYRHNWATLELLQNIARSGKNLRVEPWDFLKSNIDSLSQLSLPIWVGGVLWCLLAKSGRRFRSIGWTWVVGYALFIVMKGKTYYLMPVYAPLFAAGAVGTEQLLQRIPGHRGWLKPAVGGAIAVLLLLYGMAGWPFAMPMMSPEKFIAYEKRMGVQPEKWENVNLEALPQQYADMFGWREMAAAVAKVYDTLPAGERADCGIFARNYGEAGAIDYFGPEYGLPHAISVHQSYWLWGPQWYTGECLIVIGDTREHLEKLFRSVTRAGETYQQYAIPYENHRPIWVVRGPQFGTLEKVWPEWKAWI